MNKKKVIVLMLAAMLIGVLLTLLLAPRRGGGDGESHPAAPPAQVKPLPSEPVKAKAVIKKRRAPAAEPATYGRKPRVSTLGDPGEAMGGGASRDLEEETTGQPRQDK